MTPLWEAALDAAQRNLRLAGAFKFLQPAPPPQGRDERPFWFLFLRRADEDVRPEIARVNDSVVCSGCLARDWFAWAWQGKTHGRCRRCGKQISLTKQRPEPEVKRGDVGVLLQGDPAGAAGGRRGGLRLVRPGDRGGGLGAS